MSEGAMAAAEQLETSPPPTRRAAWPRRIETRLVLCVGLVAAADWLFYDHPLGWSLGLYVAITLAVLAVAQPHALRQRAGLTLFVLVLGLAAASALHPTPHGLLLSAAGLIAFAVVGRQGWTRDVGAWIQRYFAFARRALIQPILDADHLRAWAARRDSSARRWRLLLWILPLGLGAVFAGLFAAANPVIQTWLESATETLRGALGGINAVRLVFWVVVALGAWALLRTRARHARYPSARPDAPTARALLSPAMVVRCLVVFNVLFLVQNALDLRYLLLGAALPEGMTYAGYAHRGAYPLVATALLAAGFVLVSFRAGARATDAPRPRAHVWARRLVYLWLLQNVVLTFAAATRLGLYVEAYTLTRMRLAAAIWMALVALGLVLIAVRILTHRSNRWLVGANTVAALAVVYTCCFFNAPQFIANYNVAHCQEVSGSGEPIDLDYLRALGPGALPAWQRLAATPGAAATHTAAREQLYDIRRILEEQTADWRGWTLRRARLLEAAAPR